MACLLLVLDLTAVNLVVAELLDSDERRLGQPLVMLGYIDLLAVLERFFQRIGIVGELLELLAEFLL